MLSVGEILNIGQFIFMGLGVWIAAKGLSTWKNQLQGKDEYLVSKGLLKLTYDFRDRLRDIRKPFVSVGEFGTVPENPSHVDSYYHMRGAYDSRMKPLYIVKSELNLLSLDAEAMWGKEIIELFEKLYIQQKILYSNIEWYINSFCDPSYKEIYNEYIVWNQNTKEEKFSIEIEDVIGRIELLLKKYMK